MPEPVPTVTTERNRYSLKGRVNSYGDGRLCSHEDCATVLSRYNDEDVCTIHEADRSESG